MTTIALNIKTVTSKTALKAVKKLEPKTRYYEDKSVDGEKVRYILDAELNLLGKIFTGADGLAVWGPSSQNSGT